MQPLRPAPLKAAIAAFMDVPADAITLEHETGSLRKAVARAIRAYQEHAARPPRLMIAFDPAAEIEAELDGDHFPMEGNP